MIKEKKAECEQEQIEALAYDIMFLYPFFHKLSHSDENQLRFLPFFLSHRYKESVIREVPIPKNIITQKRKNEKKGQGENNCGKREKTSDIWQRSVIR